jgi:hypothetical protein
MANHPIAVASRRHQAAPPRQSFSYRCSSAAAVGRGGGAAPGPGQAARPPTRRRAGPRRRCCRPPDPHVAPVPPIRTCHHGGAGAQGAGASADAWRYGEGGDA